MKATPKARTKRFKKQYKRWLATSFAKRLNKYGRRPKFARAYLGASCVTLLGTTALWSLLGAHLQMSNADQLANPYLFQDGATLHGAYMPGQHSFLLKWPLFYIVKLFGYSTASYLGVTLFTALLTVGALAYLLRRIEKRPLVLGSLYLAMASVLVMVPAQPYAGGLLPVNMAMLTTRNLEYIVYIAGLFCAVRAPRLRSKQCAAAVILLGLLMASDKLFLSVSLGGALVALVAYALREQWALVSLAVRWLLASIAAGLAAMATLAAITATRLTHIVSQGPAGPYGLTHGLKALALGTFYAFTGTATNFGANPGYDALTLHQLPHNIAHNVLFAGNLAYLINLIIFGVGLLMAWQVLHRSLGLARSEKLAINSATQLSSLLIWAALAATGLFIVTNHYYVVDARYLAISVFAVFVAMAVWARGKRLHPSVLLLSGLILAASVLAGSIGSVTMYHAQKSALAATDARNKTIALTIARRHHVDVLVGDYWRVLPIKQLSGMRQTVLPLDGCTTPRAVLASQAWQLNLHKHSFTYLLTLDGNATSYPSCSVQQITTAYGLPNTSVLIAGSLTHPKELLLFYDRGIHASAPKIVGKSESVATVLPINLADMPNTACQPPTIMNVVAHQDDDLLFMSPDVLHDIKAGACIRSVYLTAGDAGAGQSYWLARERGSEAAYAEMTGSQAIWINRIVRLPGGQFINVANPKGNANISLIFMHLPDGNLRGEGFNKQHESLAALEAGRIVRLTSVDRQSSYTADELTTALVNLFHAYQPAEIHTQSNYAGQQYQDHSDHRATGRFVTRAHKLYEAEQYGGYLTVPLKYYIGYPIHQFTPNVSGQDLINKEKAFLAYASFDGGVCHSIEQCRQVPTYGSYLDRQYENSY